MFQTQWPLLPDPLLLQLRLLVQQGAPNEWVASSGWWKIGEAFEYYNILIILLIHLTSNDACVSVPAPCCTGLTSFNLTARMKYIHSYNQSVCACIWVCVCVGMCMHVYASVYIRMYMCVGMGVALYFTHMGMSSSDSLLLPPPPSLQLSN